MSKRKNEKKEIKLLMTIITIILLIVLGQKEELKSYVGNILDNTISNISAEKTAAETTAEDGTTQIVIGNGDVTDSNNLHVYFIDVGQADSILIKNNEEAMLIDAGNDDDGQDVVNFIKNKGVTNLKYIVGTHPHEDHIGVLDKVINELDFEKIFLPDIQTTTKNYVEVIDALENKNKKISILKKGDKYSICGAEMEVMTDAILDKSNLNLASNIVKLTFNGTSFLFTGDAETENEKTISNWPKVDILKVGHHGSTTSSSAAFLKKIQPQYSIICVGKDNDYGHPKATILERLEKLGSKIYRTDENGTIEVIVTK